MASRNGATAAQTQTIPPLTVEEEDAIIHTRITNDERPLRRVIKKFHSYAALAHAPGDNPASTASVDEARESFLVELASFQLGLKKASMICEAEARQVEEYQRERQRIEDEHGKLRGQIEQLKTALEHAQVVRRQKIEYDLVAEKINTLPSREELEQSIAALENDMAAIRAEHDTQNRIIQGQKAALDVIISDLGSLRLMGKDKEAAASTMASPSLTPAPELVADGISEGVVPENSRTREVGEEGEEIEEKALSDDIPLSASLNPLARPFDLSSHRSTPREIKPAEDDIEMGEVEEDRKMPRGKKKVKEELEEGEASDTSSALSDPPDDD